MSAQNGNSAPQKDSLPVVIVLFAFLIIGTSLFLWFFAKPVVVSFFYWCDLPQYLLIHYAKFASHRDNSIGGYIYKVLFDHSVNRIDKNSISWAEVSVVQQNIGHKLFWIFSAIVVYFGYSIHKNMKGGGLLHIFMIKPNSKKATSFIEYQAKAFPLAGSGVDFDPEKPHPNLEPPLSPFNFMIKHRVSMKREEGVDKEQLKEIFTAQLGKRWGGFKNEPFYIQAFLLVCMTNLQFPKEGRKAGAPSSSKGNKKYGSASFNSRLALAFYSKGSDNEIEQRVREIINDQISFEPKLVAEIDKVLSGKYFFTRTAAVGLLGYCGPFRHWGGGYSQMLPPVSFQWLMKWDRPLMMALHSVGSRGVKVFIEGAGIISHFRVEQRRGSSYSVPYVTSAVEEVPRFLTEELQGTAKIYDMEQAIDTIRKSRRRF